MLRETSFQRQVIHLSFTSISLTKFTLLNYQPFPLSDSSWSTLCQFNVPFSSIFWLQITHTYHSFFCLFLVKRIFFHFWQSGFNRWNLELLKSNRVKSNWFSNFHFDLLLLIFWEYSACDYTRLRTPPSFLSYQIIKTRCAFWSKASSFSSFFSFCIICAIVSFSLLCTSSMF